MNDPLSRRQFGLLSAGLLAGAMTGVSFAQTTQPTTQPTRPAKPPRKSMHPHDGGTGEKINGHYRNGECWLDEEGKRIQGHGAGMLLHEGTYYWYGENRDGANYEKDGQKKLGAGGVACWKSTDLITWRKVGVVLATSTDPQHDLHPSKVLERPKVIYNPSTKKFVLWLHVDSSNYGYARAGVAVSDSPEGPFHYIESFRPNGFMSRDQTVFIDRQGNGYQIGSSDENSTAMITLLTDDYLKPSGKFVKVFNKRWMEAFAFCERDGKYYMIASGCTGWAPNEARSAVADNFMGPWTELGNPCVGEHNKTTYDGQSCHILPPGPANKDYLAMFDVWRPHDLRVSGYTWLPIQWVDGKMKIEYQPTFPPARS